MKPITFIRSGPHVYHTPAFGDFTGTYYREEDVRALVEALKGCADSMIALSDSTLDLFKHKSDNDDLYSWTAGHYRRMRIARDKARAALKEIER